MTNQQDDFQQQVQQHYQSGASQALPQANTDTSQQAQNFPNEAQQNQTVYQDGQRSQAADFPLNTPQPQPTVPEHYVSSGNKEAAPLATNSLEVAPIVEVGEHEIPLEVQEYMEKVEHDKLEFNEPVVYHTQPEEQFDQADGPRIILPVNQSAIIFGLDQKVNDSIRWLATWCVRIIRKFPGKVVYNPEHTYQYPDPRAKKRYK